MVVNYSAGATTQPSANSLDATAETLTYTLTQINTDRSLRRSHDGGNGGSGGVVSVRSCSAGGGGLGANGTRFHTSGGYDVKVMRESPSSSGDFSAKFNQIPVSPYHASHYHLSVPTQETLS